MGETLTVTIWALTILWPSGHQNHLPGRYADEAACHAAAAPHVQHHPFTRYTCAPSATTQVPIPADYQRRPVPK